MVSVVQVLSRIIPGQGWLWKRKPDELSIEVVVKVDEPQMLNVGIGEPLDMRVNDTVTLRNHFPVGQHERMEKIPAPPCKECPWPAMGLTAESFEGIANREDVGKCPCHMHPQYYCRGAQNCLPSSDVG